MTSPQQILFFGAAYAAVLLAVAYALSLHLLDQLQASPVQVRIVGPVLVRQERNGTRTRQAIGGISRGIGGLTRVVAMSLAQRPRYTAPDTRADGKEK